MACCISGYSLLGHFSSILLQECFSHARQRVVFCFHPLYNSHALCSRFHQISDCFISLSLSNASCHIKWLMAIYKHFMPLYIHVKAWAPIFFPWTTFPNSFYFDFFFFFFQIFSPFFSDRLSDLSSCIIHLTWKHCRCWDRY